MMTRGGEGGKKCRKFDDVICERPLMDWKTFVSLLTRDVKYTNTGCVTKFTTVRIRVMNSMMCVNYSLRISTVNEYSTHINLYPCHCQFPGLTTASLTVLTNRMRLKKCGNIVETSQTKHTE